MPTSTDDRVEMPTGPTKSLSELGPELDALRERNERVIELAAHKPGGHSKRSAVAARVGDPVIFYVSQAWRVGLVHQVTRTGRLVVAYTTPHSVHQARMMWNNHPDPNGAFASHKWVIARAELNARRLYNKFLENQQVVRDGVDGTARLICARSEGNTDYDMAEIYAETEVRNATAWLGRHSPDEIQTEFDKTYRADLFGWFTAHKTPAQPWTGLVWVREPTVKPQHASLF